MASCEKCGDTGRRGPATLGSLDGQECECYKVMKKEIMNVLNKFKVPITNNVDGIREGDFNELASEIERSDGMKTIDVKTLELLALSFVAKDETFPITSKELRKDLVQFAQYVIDNIILTK